jgi:hypothetical protein
MQGVHPTVIGQRKRQLTEDAAALFSTGIGRRGQEERGGADDTGTIHEFYRG